MLAGELYRPDEELGAEQAAAKAWMVRYNAALAPRFPSGTLCCANVSAVSARTPSSARPSTATMATTSVSATACS